MKNNLITMFDRIKLLLELDIRYQDDDNRLISRVWWEDMKQMGYDPKQQTALEFMQLYCDNKLSSAESIRRARQKIQEENPALRGSRYNERQKSTSKVKEDLKSLTPKEQSYIQFINQIKENKK